MYQLSIFCLLPLVGLLSVSEQLDNNGIGYFGTSNVRYQKTYLPPLIFSGNTQSSPISTTTDNPPSTTKTAPATADLPKINQINVTTSSGPIYIPRRKPFILPRRSKQGFGPKQQAVHASIVDELQPNLFLEKQTPKVVAPQPSFISVSQHSKVSAPQLVMQVISGPQTPTNTTLDASTVEMYVPNAIVNPTLTRVPALQVPFVTVSGPNASLVAVQPEKESVSFDLMTDNILEKEPMSPPQADPILQIKSKLNPASPQEQDLQLKTESFLSSTTNLSKSNNISYPIKLRPQITFVPVLDSVTMEEPDTTIPRFFNISDDNQGSTTETPKKVEPVAATIESLSIGTNLSSVNTITFLPITNTTAQTPIVKEIQPPLVTVPKLPLTETETQVITAPLVVIQLITDPQQPLNSVSDIYQPDVTSIQLNRTADIQFSTPFLSVLNTPTSVISFLPKTEPALNVPNPEIKVESKLVPQLDLLRPTQPDPEQTTQIEPEHTTLSKIESPTQSTFLSKENSHTPHTVSLTVMMQPKTGENIKEHTTASPLRGDEISESSLSFETPASATSQTLVTAKSQLMELSPIQTSIITSQPTIMSTSPTSEATPTLSESVVIPYNLSQTVIQLMPPQPSLSVAPQVPVTSISKSLAVIASISSVPEAQQKTDHPELFSVSEVTDSKFELSTPQEFKQDVRLNSESAFDLKSESTIKPEVKISNMPYIDPVKLRPQVGFVTIPDSEWKYVSLKSEPAVLPPLLPRPIPVREPAYGRHYFIQYPITSSTNNVSKVNPITKPTLAPFISTKPYNFWQTTKPEPATQSESTVQPEPEHNTQLEPEHTTLPKSETTTQSKLNLHTSKTVPLAVMIQPKIGEYIKEHTTVPPLRDDDISKSSFSFETPASAANQTLVTTKSQLMELSSLQTPRVTSQPAIMTTSPMPEATTTLPESVVIPNNQSQTVIIQLIMPPQPSLSVAPQIPLAFTASMSSVPEAQQKTDEHELFSVSKVTDPKLELSTPPPPTPQELKQDAQLNSESTPDFKSESTFKPEVATSSMPYTDPGKLRPQAGFVTVPDSEWKYVSLKTEPAVEPTLLTRPIPVSLPSYGRHYFIQNPITSSTNNVSKVTLITKPTLAPFISSKPYNFWKTSEPEPTTQSESTVQPEPEYNIQLEPEHTTLPKSETTTHSILNLHISKTVPLAVMIQPEIGEHIKEHTTIPPLRDDDISESSFSFETSASATNQTLVTAKSQLIELSSLQTPTVTSQPAIMTTSPMPEATTTLPESVVIPNNQSQTVIIQLIMPPQPSLSVAPQIPLAFTASMSSVPEAQQKTDEHELFSVSKVTDPKLELSTPQELKQDAQLNSESTPDFKSESTFKPEVATSSMPYTDPGKLRPQAGFVTVPDSEWKYVSLKTEPAVEPTLLTRPIPVSLPSYGRHYFIQNPITSSTNNVSKVTLITKPTLAPFISSKPYNFWKTSEPEPTTQSESTVQPEPEYNIQLEPEHTTLPKSETTTHSILNLHISKTVPLAVMIQPEIGEHIKEHTTIPPLRDDDISESSFSFETSASATNQTLVTAKSQLIELSSLQTPTVTSQPAIMTTSPMPEATTTLPESVVIPNNQSQTGKIRLIMPPQPSLSVAPQIPLAITASMSSVPEAQQKTDEHELFSVSKVTDSKLELSTPQELKQDAQLNSESTPDFKSESTFKPEVATSSKPYTDPGKLRPQAGFVTVPDSEWKYVSLRTEPAVVPPLLPRPNPVREPAYGHHYFIQYPITSSTNHVSKVTPITKPTVASFISTKPYNGWQTTEPEPTTQSESTVQPEPEHNTQLEHTTLPKSETTTQSKLNLHISKTVPLAVMIQPKIGEHIKEHTTVPPLRDDYISESSFSFETSASATNQTLVTAKSQLIELASLQTPTVTSQPAIMTTSLMPEATTTLPESVVIPNNKSETVIIQLIMPPQPSRSAAPQIPLPDSEWKYVSLKSEAAVLPPLFPRPIPVRQPSYGRHYFIQNPITSSTNHVYKVTPITKPTVASFISTKPYNGWQTTEPEPTTQSESTVQPDPEHNTQLEPEHTTLPKSETTTQSKLNLHISKTVPLAVMIQPKTREHIKEHTTVPPHRDDDISESSFSFETPASATIQTLDTAKLQLMELFSLQTPTVTSQPAITTTSLMPKATTTLPESIVIPNNQSQTVITQLIMPPQPSLSVAPQVPVTPISKPLALIESMSSAPQAQQKTDHPELFSVSEVTDSKLELSASQDVRLNLESASVLKSESTIKPEVEISTKFYIYPAKLIQKMGSVMVPGSEWKYVSLKQQPASFPSLLPKPNLVREPVYNRHYNTQYPITLSTNYVPTVTPSIKPTPAPFIYTKPYTMWQLNYGRYNPATPIIEITQNTTEVPSNNVFTSKRPDSFNLDFVCKEGNGYYAVENECDAYILCQKNKAVKYSCPDGLYFNPAAKYHEYPCTYPSEVQCTNSTGKQNTIHTLTATRQCPKQYGLFSMNDGDCSKYIMCNIGVATVMNCPAGLVFNPSTESCDWVANVPQCSPQVFKDYTCPDPPMDEYGVATDIIYKYKYRNQCTQYIACQRGYPRLLSCEGGLAFDEESQSCISYVYVKGCASYAV